MEEIKLKLISDGDDITHWVKSIINLEGEVLYKCERCGGDKVGFVIKYLPKKYVHCYKCGFRKHIKKNNISRTEEYDNKIN